MGEPWSPSSPFRVAAERRRLLAELDALVALSRGLTVDDMCIIYCGFAFMYGRGIDAPCACKHNVSMVNVLIRGLPEDVHAALQRKAEEQHQSLQQYLTVELRRLVARRRVSDVLDEVEARQDGHVGFEQAAEDLAQIRSER